jgi:hypothetical protein
VDRSLKRKWLYPIVYLPVLLRLILLAEFDFFFRYPFGHFYYNFGDYVEVVFYISLAVFTLGLLDVVLTYRTRFKARP